MKKQKLFLVVSLAVICVFIATWYFIGCPPLKSCPFRKPQQDVKKIVNLTFIGPWDNVKDWQEIALKFNMFKKKAENGGLDVNVKYEKIKDPINYEDIIAERQFEDKGPNIFMVFQSWIPRYKNKILPAPKDIINPKEFEDTFAQVAKDDLVSEDDKIYAIPFYVDTLGLYYNKDMFFSAGIIKPPETWEEFKNYTERLTIRDERGNIVRAGAAFGSGSLINRSTDIIMLLIMQNNVSNPENLKNISSLNTPEAVAAVKFYTDFTDPQKRFYTWNEDQIYSIDAFTSRKAAMMINYSYHIGNVINKTSGTLNLGTAPIPQLDINNKINYASYWVPVVAKKSYCRVSAEAKNVDCYHLAWEFLKFAADKKNVYLYLDSVKMPAANLEVANKQEMDYSDLRNAFSSQVSTAKSWFHPYDSTSDKILENMIDSIITNDINKKQTTQEAVSSATKSIEALNYQ